MVLTDLFCRGMYIVLITDVFWIKKHKGFDAGFVRRMFPFHQLGPTRPSWSVSRHVRLSVCVRNRETPTSRGFVDLWSKIVFLILVWDDTISQKRGGPVFFPRLLKHMVLHPPPPLNTHFRRSCRPLVKDCVPNIGLRWHNFPKKGGIFLSCYC